MKWDTVEPVYAQVERGVKSLFSTFFSRDPVGTNRRKAKQDFEERDPKTFRFSFGFSRNCLPRDRRVADSGGEEWDGPAPRRGAPHEGERKRRRGA